jgi:LEA14-like dessication related protein
MQPEFRRVENYQLHRQGSAITLGADVVCYNPNRMRFHIKNLQANIFMNEQKVATLGKELNIIAKGKSEFSVPLSIAFSASDAIKSVWSQLGALLKKQEVLLSVSGKIKLKTLGIVKGEFPFTYEKKIDLNPFD